MQDARKLNRIQEIMSEIIPKFFNPLKGKIPQQMQVMPQSRAQQCTTEQMQVMPES
jgi:hypothetical protein